MAKDIPLKARGNNIPSVKAYVRSMNAQHVTPKNGEWQVKKSGTEKATKVFSTQQEAINHAREIAKKHEQELLIHGRNGQIRERNSYGKDSFPPRG